MHYDLEIFMEKHDSDNDYYELMTCLKKHQLALESVPCKVLSSITMALIILVKNNLVI